MPLTKDEIRSLLGDIENERVERTLSTDNTKKMSEAICSFANDIRNKKNPGYFIIGADDDGNLYGKVNLENFPNETDYRNPNIAEIMLNLGYVNRFGSGVNTVSTLLEENKSNPAEFLLGDYTTFKVVVQNADVVESGTNDTVKSPDVIVNSTESDTNVTNNVTNKGTIVTNNVTNNTDFRKGAVIELMRKNKRISVTQIAKELNVTRRTIFRIIDGLKSENRIKRVGDLKSGTWEIIE